MDIDYNIFSTIGWAHNHWQRKYTKAIRGNRSTTFNLQVRKYKYEISLISTQTFLFSTSCTICSQGGMIKTALSCVLSLGALLTGRVSADEHCSSCQPSWWYDSSSTQEATPDFTSHTSHTSRYKAGSGQESTGSAELQGRWLQWLSCCVSLVWEPSSLAESLLASTAAAVRWAGVTTYWY